jgi:hypothetical protein
MRRHATTAGLIAASVVAAWLGMQHVHELGHMLAAWGTGGRVSNVALHPLGISRTDVAENPQPLAVAWGGPLFGAGAPLAVWLVAAGLLRQKCCSMTDRVLAALRCFAGFCLIANGAYLGFGALERIGDCGELLSRGAALWQLWLFGLVTMPVGFYLWHQQGKHFGLGRDAEPVPIGFVAVMGAIAGALAGIGWLVGD